jgi:uncharacterized protein (DUF849 family)
MSPYLPFAPEDIARQAIDAAHAGATVLHLHARDPDTGRPSADPAHYAAFLPQIAAECDAVINLTTGGSAIMTLEERLAAPLRFAPEMCSLNMGTMNFALYPMADKPRDWRFDWEEPFLRNSDDLVFKNTPRDIEGVLTKMGQERGAQFEFECYDISHLYMLRHFVDRGLVTAPLFIQFVFGVLGGMGPDHDTLDHMVALGAALFSPVFSTVRGGAGAYVSDLWVAPEARGQALGTALLAAVAERTRSDWNASFIKLISYSDNDEALRFYARLGFAPLRGETGLTLSGAPLAALSRQTQKDPQ